MGVFDEVAFRCDKCGANIYAQSKAGHCYMASYRSDDVPIAVAADLDNTRINCNGCGETYTMIALLPVNRVAMTLS